MRNRFQMISIMFYIMVYHGVLRTGETEPSNHPACTSSLKASATSLELPAPSDLCRCRCRPSEPCRGTSKAPNGASGGARTWSGSARNASR